jgi:hypothetical protein
MAHRHPAGACRLRFSGVPQGMTLVTHGKQVTAAAEAAIILAEFLNYLVSVSAQLFRQRAQQRRVPIIP